MIKGLLHFRKQLVFDNFIFKHFIKDKSNVLIMIKKILFHLIAVCIIIFPAVIFSIKGDGVNWMAMGFYIDGRFSDLGLEKGDNEIKLGSDGLNNQILSGSVEWVGMAQDEVIYFKTKLLPGISNLAAQYTDEFKSYPKGNIKNSRLGIFSYFNFLTSYQVIDSRWGSGNIGFYMGHLGAHFNTGHSKNLPEFKLYFANFFVGPLLSYSISLFNLFHIRVGAQLSIPLYNNNNKNAILNQQSFEFFFPMDINSGWSGMKEQNYMIKLGILRRQVTCDSKKFGIDYEEWITEVGFFWVY
jgi:hypothetical protein